MEWKATPDRFAGRSTLTIALDALVRGLIAGVIFGAIMAASDGSSPVVRGVIFGLVMGAFFFGYMLYLRSKGRSTTRHA